MNKSIVLLAVLTFSAACSRVEKAEKTMTDMKKQTQEMSATTNDMNATMESQYQQLRSGDTVRIRGDQFEILMSEEKHFGSKLAAACVLYKSFEFQLWTGVGKDSDYYRNKLFADAANEMTRHLSDLYPLIDTKTMSPTKAGKSHSYEQAFYALAVGMHMNHNFQDVLTEANPSVKQTSFYDLIKESLRNEMNKENPEHENILVNGLNREIMIELVKARVDMLSALALKNLTDKRDMTIGQKIKGAIFKITGGALGSIDLPEVFTKSNNATNAQTIKYLDGAKKARAFLAEIGVKKELEETLHSAFSNIDLGLTKDQPKEDGNLRRGEIRRLIDGLLQK